MAFNLSTLYVDIKANEAPFHQAMEGVRRDLTRTDVAVGSFIGNLASGLAGLAMRFGSELFAGTISSASNLAESMSKTQQIFGSATGTINAQAQDMATKFGLPKQAMIDAAANFGMMGSAAGKSGKDAAEFGNKMTKLAADAMSFYNVPMDEALERIRSGLSGEAEPMRKFNVFLNEGAVQAEALALGLIKSGQTADDGAKIMARASLITKGMAVATGDLERTSGGTENQMRAFWGTLSNLGQEIGTTLLPAFNAVLTTGVDMARSLAAGFAANKVTFDAWVASLTSGDTLIGVIWRNWGDIWEITTTRIGVGMANVGAIVQAVGENIVNIAAYIGKNWYQLIVDAINATGTAFTNFGTNITNFGEAIKTWATGGGWDFQWTGLLTGFKATAEALPAVIKPTLIAVEDQIAHIEERMAGRESARAAAAAAAVPSELAELAASAERTEPAMAAAAAAAGKEKAFKAKEMDLSDFARDLRLAQEGGDVPQKQLTELQQIREYEAKNAELMTKMLDRQFAAILG